MVVAEQMYTYSEICDVLSKSHLYVKNIEKRLKMPNNTQNEGYPVSFLMFMERIVALRAFSVSLDDIADLYVKEIKILQMLHFDSVDDGPYWFLGVSTSRDKPDRQLLLTGYDLGFPLWSNAVQANLDFRSSDKELFDSREMGEDLRRIMDPYRKLYERVRSRVESERPVLKNALIWSDCTFGHSATLRAG